MKLFRNYICLMAGAALMLASCDDETAEQPTAALSVDKLHYEVNENMTVRFVGNADNVVVYPGDEDHDYELRDQSNTGLVVNKGFLNYSYQKPGIFHVVCVATNHEDAGNSLKSDTTSVWVTVTDNANAITNVSISLFAGRNEVYADLVNGSDWLLSLSRKARFNGRDGNIALKNQTIAIYQESPSQTVEIKKEADADYEPFKATTKRNLADVFDIRSTSASGDVRDYRLYTLYYGEFKAFKLAGVAGTLVRSEYDYAATTMNIEVPAGTDLTAIAPEFTLNDPANEKVYIGDVEQTSGTPVDFTSPVTYRFVAAHASNPAITVESTCVVTATVK